MRAEASAGPGCAPTRDAGGTGSRGGPQVKAPARQCSLPFPAGPPPLAEAWQLLNATWDGGGAGPAAP